MTRAIDWDLPTLQFQAERFWPGLVVEYVDSIDSTNSELLRRARAGQLKPTLLLAQTQTAGRGRMGRHWHSAGSPQTGESLTFSLGLPLAKLDWSGLSLALGVAIAQSLEAGSASSSLPRLQLKWPNDLWWQGRKLGGILIETLTSGSSLYAVIGLGLNIQRPGDAGFATPPAGLIEIDPNWSAPRAMHGVLPGMLASLLRFASEGFAAFHADFGARDALRGRDVLGGRYEEADAQSAWSGLACGVDQDGALLVHTAEGMKRIRSSEVSVRPVAAKAPAPPSGP